jgi:hypothetical protein
LIYANASLIDGRDDAKHRSIAASLEMKRREIKTSTAMMNE